MAVTLHPADRQCRVVPALSRLQAEALDDPTLPAKGDATHMTAEAVERAVALADAHGFQAVGCGSTRLAVEVAGDTVAKVAFDLRGVIYNLQEATAWLWVADELRAHLAPCVALAPSLVLFQERLEVLGPTLIETMRRDTLQERTETLHRFHGEIEDLRFSLGFEATTDGVRLDNYGQRDGQIVLLDYAERWPPFEVAWGWVLDQLDEGPVRLDQRGRAAFWEQWSWPARPPSMSELARRAGCEWVPGDSDAATWMAFKSDEANAPRVATSDEEA